MECTMKYKEGIYRRRKKLQDFDPYTPEMYQSIHETRSKVLKIVADYRSKIRKKSSKTRFLKS